MPTERPALLRFRVRALAGVGGRADVLVSLLAVPDAWRDAASFDEVGIAKRNVARVLGELADGGLVEARVRGNAREFRLRAPDALAALVDRPRHAVFPPWMVLFEGMSTALGLGALPADRPSSRRVAIARSRAGIDELAVSLGAARPTGDPEAVLARVERLLRSLAEDEPVADPATIGEAIDQQARLSTVGAGLRLRGSAFDPRGPWIVTRSGTAEVVGAGRTPHEAVDAALAALAR